MNLDLVPAAQEIASSTTWYLGVFAPVFYLIIGLVLAFVVGNYLVYLVTGRQPQSLDETMGEDDD